MTPDPLLLFPLAALVLVVCYPALGRNGKAPSSLGNRDRRRQLLGRVAVITLPIGAVVAEIWPLWPAPYLGKAAQALLFFAIVMLPLVTAHVVVTRRQRRTAVRGAVATASDASRRLQTLLGGTASARVAKGVSDAKVDAAEPLPEEWSLTALRPSEADDAPAGAGRTGDERDDEREAVPVPIGRHAERLDARDPGKVTRSLLESGTSASRKIPVPSGTSEATATNPESASALKAVARELRGMRGREIVGLVHALRTDRSHLRKVVIARQAACASERRARERAQAVTRDAIGALQRARASQKLAEKVARRERRERLRVEAKYERAAHALNNAMSIIRSGRYPRAGGAAKRETVRPKADAKDDRALETH